MYISENYNIYEQVPRGFFILICFYTINDNFVTFFLRVKYILHIQNFNIVWIINFSEKTNLTFHNFLRKLNEFFTKPLFSSYFSFNVNERNYMRKKIRSRRQPNTHTHYHFVLFSYHHNTHNIHLFFIVFTSLNQKKKTKDLSLKILFLGNCFYFNWHSLRHFLVD